MAEMTWEKSPEKNKNDKQKGNNSERLKFIIGGLLILGAVGFLLLSGTMSGARFFIQVDDVVNNAEYAGQTVRLTGAVLGDSIEYDATTGTLQFTIANMPAEYDDLSQALHDAANNPNATQLTVYMVDTTMPDLLQHEAQAILTGEINADGVFHATELNLKCPTRFEEHTPGMLQSS